MNTPTYRPSRLPWFLLAGLLLLGSVGLFAQQRIASPASAPSSCLTPLVAADSSSSAAEARALLPLIPPKAPSPLVSLPGERPPDPNAFKILYGYRGPYYNTAALDGQVVVLDGSIYAWPTATWKVTGLFRNQTRCPVQIRSVTARLLGSEGELLGIATATTPVDTLRPGEPGPFVIDAQLAGVAVKSVEWHIDYAMASSPVRQFTFTIDENRVSSDGTEYDLGGIVQNTATTTVHEVRAVAAWLDDQNRVLSVATLEFDDHGNPVAAVDLAATGDENYRDSGVFNYTTQDPALVQGAGHAANLALWGISK